MEERKTERSAPRPQSLDKDILRAAAEDLADDFAVHTGHPREIVIPALVRAMEHEDSETTLESLVIGEGFKIDDRTRAVLARAWSARRRALADAIERWVNDSGILPAFAVGQLIPDLGPVVRIIDKRAQYVVRDAVTGRELTVDFETLRPERAPV